MSSCAPADTEVAEVPEVVVPVLAETTVPSSPTGWPERRAANEPVQFVDIGASAPFNDENSSSGISLVDFDNDGWPDLTTLGGTGVYLFRNRGDGRFDPAPGVTPSGDAVRAPTGVVYGDVDNDGDLDLFVTSFVGDRLYIQLADGSFEDATVAAGIHGAVMSHGASMADLDGDQDLDILVAVEARSATHDDDFETVWRNHGDGTFESVATQIGLGGTPDSVTYQMVVFDMNGDTHPDVFVAHDYLPNQVYINRGDGTFADESKSWTPDDPVGLMGADVGDIDGDGHLDVYATNYGGDRLYRYDEYGSTRFMSYMEFALNGGYDPTVDVISWGVALLDLDNDADLDVVTTASATGKGTEDFLHPPFAVVLENRGVEAKPSMLQDISPECGPIFDQYLDASSLATGDIDRDGDVDIVLSVGQSELAPEWFLANTTRRSVLLLNISARAQSNKSLTLHLRQPGRGNTFAVGARVDVEAGGKRTSRVLLAGSSYASSNSQALHFGLGSSNHAELVRVTWPDGRVDEIRGLEAGERQLDRGSASGVRVTDRGFTRRR